jgi:predicted RNase H-like HicB family nuclease
MSARTLHCYAQGDEEGWEAICLDLDVAVQGDTFSDVYRALNDAIALYVESLADVPALERERLLHRSAPITVRLKFLAYALRALFLGRAPGYHHEFTMPLGASGLAE